MGRRVNGKWSVSRWVDGRWVGGSVVLIRPYLTNGNFKLRKQKTITISQGLIYENVFISCFSNRLKLRNKENKLIRKRL